MDNSFLIFISVLAFYLAWNLGANDVANSMGTSVGSKAVTLRQALVIAGVLEFTGAVLFGREVSATLTQNIVHPALFAATPYDFVMGMVAALLACGLWLQIATLLALPVSSSHATVGAIAGFGWVAFGRSAINWDSIGLISLTWVLTPVVSGAIAALFYSQVRRWILDQPNPQQQLYEWIPWLSSVLVGVFGIIVFPSVLSLQPFHHLPIPSRAVCSIKSIIFAPMPNPRYSCAIATRPTLPTPSPLSTSRAAPIIPSG